MDNQPINISVTTDFNGFGYIEFKKATPKNLITLFSTNGQFNIDVNIESQKIFGIELSSGTRYLKEQYSIQIFDEFTSVKFVDKEESIKLKFEPSEFIEDMEEKIKVYIDDAGNLVKLEISNKLI